jgi:hypothetical protein
VCNATSLAMRATKRATPTLSFSNITVYDGGANPSVTSMTNISTASVATADFVCSSGGLTTGRPGAVGGTGGASSYIDIAAEL